MVLEERASDQLDKLYNEGPPDLCDRVDRVLDELERDHGQAWLRVRRLQNPPAFVVPVRLRAYDYLILWRLDGEEAVVLYIGETF